MNIVAIVAAAMMTSWGEKVTSENCWRDYPRPQMVRANWTCLNGLMTYDRKVLKFDPAVLRKAHREVIETNHE